MAGESTLLSALLQDQGTYLADNPWYGAGASILRNPSPAPRNNTEAFILPLLQGLSGGLMAGYGEGQADKRMTNDYQSSIAQILGQPDYKLPSDFSPENAKMTIAKALMDKEQQNALDLIDARSKTDPSSSAARVLSLPEKQLWAERLGLKPDEATLINSAGDLDRIMRDKQLSGEKVRPPSSTELSQINANDYFQGRIADLKNLAEGLDSNSVLRATKGGKLFSWLGDTESKDYKFYAGLKAAQQEYARAKDSGALSAFDVKIWGPLFEGLPLLDSGKAIKDRLADVDRTIKRSKLNMLDNLQKGQVNISGFENDRSALSNALNSGIFEQPKTIEKPNPKQFKDGPSYLAAVRAWESAGGQ